MPTCHRTPGPLLLFLVTSLLGAGCREHPQQPGTYALQALRVEADSCGWWTAGIVRPTTVMLDTPGNEVFGELTSPRVPLWGRFLWEDERFRIAGSVADQELTLEGGTCEIALLTAVLEARTLKAETPTGERFEGRLTLQTRARHDAGRCSCWIDVEVVGVLQQGADGDP